MTVQVFEPDGRLVSVITPLRTADHAARLVWLTDNCPRAALSLTVAVNKSSSARSCIGRCKAASGTMLTKAPKPDQAFQVGSRLEGVLLVQSTLFPSPLQLAQSTPLVSGDLR